MVSLELTTTPRTLMVATLSAPLINGSEWSKATDERLLKTVRMKERHNERATKFKRPTERKSDKLKERHNERVTKSKERQNERATERKSDITKERHNERVTKLPKIELYSIGLTKFFSIDNTQKKLKQCHMESDSSANCNNVSLIHVKKV